MPKPIGCRYTVSGSGHFPTDMLRYDKATIVGSTEEEPDWGERMRKPQRDVVIESKYYPTEGRWNSFGWTVSKIEKTY